MASAAVCIKAVILFLVLFFPMVYSGLFSAYFCGVVLCVPLYFFNHLAELERAGCITSLIAAFPGHNHFLFNVFLT